MKQLCGLYGQTFFTFRTTLVLTGKDQLLPVFLYIATVIFLQACAALGYGCVVWSPEVCGVCSLRYYL